MVAIILQYQILSRLLNGITSKHQDDFYCLNCLHSFATENKLKSHEKILKRNIFVEHFCRPERIMLEFK